MIFSVNIKNLQSFVYKEKNDDGRYLIVSKFYYYNYKRIGFDRVAELIGYDVKKRFPVSWAANERFFGMDLDAYFYVLKSVSS